MPENIEELAKKIEALTEGTKQTKQWCKERINAIEDGMTEAFERNREQNNEQREEFFSEIMEKLKAVSVAVKEWELTTSAKVEEMAKNTTAYNKAQNLSAKQEREDFERSMMRIMKGDLDGRRVDNTKNHEEIKSKFDALDRKLYRIIQKQILELKETNEQEHVELLGKMEAVDEKMFKGIAEKLQGFADETEDKNKTIIGELAELNSRISFFEDYDS